MLIAAGALHALSFAPVASGSLQIICLSVLVFQLCSVNDRYAPSRRWGASALRAWVFATCHLLVGIHWIFISLHTYGSMHPAIAGLAVLALSGGLALYAAAAGALSSYWLHGCDWRRGKFRGLVGISGFANFWTLSEWLRGTLFTGFPWLNPGYAHIDGWLSGWAPLLGVYGITWMAAFTAAALGMSVAQRMNQQTGWTSLGLAAIPPLVGLILGNVPWGEPYGAPLSVRLVQGNVSQDLKFDTDRMVEIMRRHARLAASGRAGEAQLVVLPETAIPVFQDELSPDVWRGWIELASKLDATLITGVPIHAIRAGGVHDYYNSVVALDRNSSADALGRGVVGRRYDKRHLVPFGEFIPLGFRWFVNAMVMPLGDFSRGAEGQTPFLVAGQRIAPNICYEDLFGEELLPAIAQGGATVLLNVSNLAWFGDSIALTQHLNIGRMRSLETARPMLRATNTGITAAIDAQGRIIKRLPSQRSATLLVSVQGWQGRTLYVAWGNLPVLLLCLIVLSGGLPMVCQRPRRKPS